MKHAADFDHKKIQVRLKQSSTFFCNSNHQQETCVKHKHQHHLQLQPVPFLYIHGCFFHAASQVVTGDSPDFGWAVKPDGPDGRKGLTGKQFLGGPTPWVKKPRGKHRNGGVVF